MKTNLTRPLLDESVMDKDCTKWKEVRTFTKLEHKLYEHRVPKKPNDTKDYDIVKENYCIITFARGTVVAVAITKDKEVLLIEHFRPAANRCIIDLPGGRVEKRKNGRKQIEKEVKEETGYSFKKFSKIYKTPLFQNPTRLTDRLTLFLAEDEEARTAPTSKEMAEQDSKVIAIKINEIQQFILNNKKETVEGIYKWPAELDGIEKEITRNEFCDLTTIAALSLFFLRK